MFQLLLKYMFQLLLLLTIIIKVNSETHIIPSYKYILKWTSDADLPHAGEGRYIFLEKNCTYNNCYITSDREYLDDYTDFPVILFNAAGVSKMKGRRSWPKARNPAQSYVFFAEESADNFPICINVFKNFFNWTWTYKLTSHLLFPYMTIRDKHHKVIGPKLGIKWLPIQDMNDINDELKLKLKRKTKLVAWFVSNWFPRSQRIRYSLELNEILFKLGYSIDIYGRQGIYTCENCLDMLEKDYYFYLSFENSLSTDYVTEKLLHPLLHYTVPIVYGGADYSRFVPNGSYLNAIEINPENLASIMVNLMKHPEEYYKFFKWHNHYSYHYPSDSPDTDAYCSFCKRINNRKLMKKRASVKNIEKWWNPARRCNLNNININRNHFLEDLVI